MRMGWADCRFSLWNLFHLYNPGCSCAVGQGHGERYCDEWEQVDFHFI